MCPSDEDRRGSRRRTERRISPVKWYSAPTTVREGSAARPALGWSVTFCVAGGCLGGAVLRLRGPAGVACQALWRGRLDARQISRAGAVIVRGYAGAATTLVGERRL
jgi:hypothetical protein